VRAIPYARSVKVFRVDGADAFLERARPLLLADEARHNLAFGILSTARVHPELYREVQGWVARDGARVVGAALRTPPYNLVVIQPVVETAMNALAQAIEDELPGVVGAVPEVDVFARAWMARRDMSTVIHFEQGVYALRAVTSPTEVAGGMRLADLSDRPLLLDWVDAFAKEALHEGPAGDRGRQERSVDARLAGGDAGFALWELGGRPVSLVGFGGPTPNGIRIGPVYTPPELRGRGYASGLTAQVSQLLLDRGHRVCFLYTDLANPTSNAIYLRIGYERVCDSRELGFLQPQVG
jgi:predicted GNAT family acetyltransferase